MDINLVTDALKNGSVVFFHIIIPGAEISTRDDTVALMDDCNDVIRIVLEETESIIKISKSDISDIHIDDNHYTLSMGSGIIIKFDVF